jgi:hypothetical protein
MMIYPFGCGVRGAGFLLPARNLADGGQSVKNRVASVWPRGRIRLKQSNYPLNRGDQVPGIEMCSCVINYLSLDHRQQTVDRTHTASLFPFLRFPLLR